MATFHLPIIVAQNVAVMVGHLTPLSDLSFTIPLATLWLFGVAVILRSRTIGFFAAMLAPLISAAMLISAGVLDSISWLLVAWAVTQGLLSIAIAWAGKRHRHRFIDDGNNAGRLPSMVDRVVVNQLCVI